MGLWGRKEADGEVPARRKSDTGVRDSFDELAISLAGGTMPRRRALRLFGAAIVGTVMASVPGVALAKPCRPGEIKCGKKCCPGDARCVRGECVCPTGENLVDGMCRCIDRDFLNDTCPAGYNCQVQAAPSGNVVVSHVCCPAGTCCVDQPPATSQTCASGPEEGSLSENGCVCLRTTEGTTVCTENNGRLCSTDVACTHTSDCPAGFVCEASPVSGGRCRARCGTRNCDPQTCSALGITPNPVECT
jgi:hypothetical protein